jgi:hypothetical protein
VFCYFEPVFDRHQLEFDHYAFSVIRASTWQKILADLDTVAETARDATSVAEMQRVGVGFHRPGIVREFQEDFRSNAVALRNVAQELVSWVRDQLRTHENVSVLGM